MKVVVNQLLIYQGTMVLSRGVGFLRDFLIIFFVGLGTLSDQLFFLLTYSDVLMTLFLGGGSAIFVSIAMAKHESSNDVLGSALVFYLFLGLALMIVEVLSQGVFGENLFSGLRDNTELQSDYFTSLIILCFILPTGLFNGVFLFYEKLYLQPLMNLIFSTIVVLGLIGLFFIVAKITTKTLALLLVFAACVRFFVSFLVCSFLHKINWRQLGFISVPSFYKNLFVSGLSVGFIFIIPYLFRGGLPRYVEGGFALASMAFKVNDLMITLFIIPVVSLLIKRGTLSFGPGLVLTFFGVLVSSLFAFFVMNYIPAIYSLEPEKFDVIRFSILSGILIAPSVFVTLYFVNISRASVSFVVGALVLIAILFFGDNFQSLSCYYYYLYSLFFIFISVHVIYYNYWFDEFGSGG